MKFNPLEFPSCLAVPDRLTRSAWQEHIPFAFACIEMLRPRVFAELGTHNGDSYLAFCQAVEMNALSTRCYAVDTWQGDKQAGIYSSGVLDRLRAHHDPKYAHFSRLVQSTFDDARQEFQEGDIDLLHIDGLHSYEAVKHDFENWLPFMSDRGVILFHDTDVTRRGFGVWRLWQELETQFPSFEFKHGCGLGVLGVGPNVNEHMRALFSLSAPERELVRLLFHTLGRRVADGKPKDFKTVSRWLLGAVWGRVYLLSGLGRLSRGASPT